MKLVVNNTRSEGRDAAWKDTRAMVTALEDRAVAGSAPVTGTIGHPLQDAGRSRLSHPSRYSSPAIPSFRPRSAESMAELDAMFKESVSSPEATIAFLLEDE